MFLHDQNDQLLDDGQLQIKYCREHAGVSPRRATFMLAFAEQ